MAVLLAAITFHFTVHRRTARSEPPAGPFRARLVACVSLGLWLAVALAGKMVGIYGDDLRKDPPPFQARLSSVCQNKWDGQPSQTCPVSANRHLLRLTSAPWETAATESSGGSDSGV